MALDNEFFDSINIEVVKKKYYNANKVEAVLQTIREQAAALNAENEALKERLATLDRQHGDISDAVITAKELCNRMVEDACRKSDEIIASAEAEKQKILKGSVSVRDYSIQRVEDYFSRMREIQLSGLDALNSEWQAFLADLPDEDYPGDSSSPRESVPVEAPVPSDLTDKVHAIMDEISAMEDSNTES